jgi:predicted  nucleic acid-binding Zn-ribbon protein
MQRALRNNIAKKFEAMRIVREKSASAIVKIEGNVCAAATSAIHADDELQSRTAIATHRGA